MTGTLPVVPDRGAIVPLRLVAPALLFERRSARLAALAQGHPAGAYLGLLSRLAAGQRTAVREIAVATAARRRDGPPLAHDRVARDEEWRRMLRVVVATVRQGPELPAQTRATLGALQAAGVDALEHVADAVLAGEVGPERIGWAPFVGAALQAWFSARSATLDRAEVARADFGCPVCGAPPVAGVVQGDDRLRYLSCSLCAAEWHLTRIHCASCRASAGLAYFHLEHDPGVDAEACEACRSYVKQLDLEKRPGAEPLADDAATLSLDLLLAEQGYRRGGVNLLLGISAA